jgi:hypothetical protein
MLNVNKDQLNKLSNFQRDFFALHTTVNNMNRSGFQGTYLSRYNGFDLKRHTLENSLPSYGLYCVWQ